MGWRRHSLEEEEEFRMATKVVKKATARPVSKLDMSKSVKVSSSAKPRSKGDVFGTIAQHVGIHRRDVAAVFHVMGSLIKADIAKRGSGVSKVPGLMRITVERKPPSTAPFGMHR